MNLKVDKPYLGFMTKNYLVLTLTAMLWGIPASICNTYFSLYVFGLGGTEFNIGLIIALGNATFVIFAIIGGHIADMYGRKKLVSIMTIFLGLSELLFALSPNWQFLTFAIIFLNVAWIFEPAYFAMLADSINKEKRGTAFAIYSCISFIPWAIMPSIGGSLIDSYGIVKVMRWSYVSLAFAGIISGIMRLFLLTETIEKKVEGKVYSIRAVGGLVKDAFREHLQTWKWMPYAALALTLSYILWAFEFGLVEPYWIVYAQDVIGISSTEWGIIISIGSIVNIVSKALIVGKLLDKISRRKILLAITISDAFTYLIFIRSGMFLQVFILWTISSFIWSFYEATYSSLEADLIPGERRGRVFAAFSVAWSAFSVPASLLGGYIFERVNPELSFVIASVSIFVCFILTALFIKTPKKSKLETNDT